jgi:hypothetical protein
MPIRVKVRQKQKDIWIKNWFGKSNSFPRQPGRTPTFQTLLYFLFFVFLRSEWALLFSKISRIAVAIDFSIQRDGQMRRTDGHENLGSCT